MREPQLGGYLTIGEPLPLPEEDRLALLVGQSGERLVESEQLVARRLGSGDEILNSLEIRGALEPRTTVRGALTRETDVVRDLEELRLRGLRLEAVHQAPARVQIRRLHGVFRLLGRAEQAKAVQVDPAMVLVEEFFGELGRRAHPPSLEERSGRVVPQKGQATSRQSSMRMSKLSPLSGSTVHVSSRTWYPVTTPPPCGVST